jgi:hypothetical protein
MARKEENYLGIIGDLVGSRKLAPKERSDVQEKFERSLVKVNQEFGDEIASLFLITLGDETQGILRRPEHCYDILREIQMELAPTEIVFGLGYGPMSTELGEYAVGADGPAFHRAREALTEAKAERKAYGKAILREVLLHSNSSLRDMVINSIFLSLAVAKRSWTAKQANILSFLRRGQSPTEVSDALKIPLSNISRTIEAAHFREFEIQEKSLQEVFQRHFSALSGHLVIKKTITRGKLSKKR